MSTPTFDKTILDKAAAIRGKRARIVVEAILRSGFVTTEALKNIGYNHPPRAIKDVTDQGLPLVRSWVKGTDGRRMASYTFGDPRRIRDDRLDGRLVSSKQFKDALIKASGGRCAICAARLDNRYLQVDHRVPYEVAGNSALNDEGGFMPLCGSCNRAKSWSCEHCQNWQEAKDVGVCKACYWASPGEYSHVAQEPVRRLDVIWQVAEVAEYEAAKRAAKIAGVTLPEFVKNTLRRLKIREQ